MGNYSVYKLNGKSRKEYYHNLAFDKNGDKTKLHKYLKG